MVVINFVFEPTKLNMDNIVNPVRSNWGVMCHFAHSKYLLPKLYHFASDTHSEITSKPKIN